MNETTDAPVNSEEWLRIWEAVEVIEVGDNRVTLWQRKTTTEEGQPMK